MHLNTEHGPQGIALTFDDGSEAGSLVYVPDSQRPGCGHWRHLGPDEQWTGPRRSCLEAAQFDALAWAADRENKARKGIAA